MLPELLKGGIAPFAMQIEDPYELHKISAEFEGPPGREQHELPD